MTTPDPADRSLTLEERFRAAGIPVPPPLTVEQEAALERRMAEAEALPRVYGPKRTP